MLKFYKKSCRPLSTGLLFLWLAGLPWAQAASPQQQPPPTPPPARESSPQNSPKPPAAAPPDQKISPQEAQELFHSVDEILQFASTDTALPIKQQVKRKLTSRDEVAAYIESHMAEDEDARRLRRSEQVLKKFGLLPSDFNLETFLLAVLREQVAGYYDPKTRTVNLLDWVEPEQQKSVLAHELTHALQDQSFGLDSWMKAGGTDLAERKQEPTSEDIDNDEISTARQAVVEGQAMAVLVDYILAPTGQSLLNSPQMVEALKAGMLVGTADSVQFANAPLYIKEALTFAYRYGLDFTTELLVQGGKSKAFAGAFLNPPRSSRQIMEPKTYLSGERLEPMRLPDFKNIFKNYDRFDVGAFGEFDVAVLIDQFAGTDTSHTVYPHWRGGYYYAARPKSDPSAPLGLLYASRWSSAQKASEFAAVYAKSLSKRYKRAREPVDDGKAPPLNLDTLQSLTGRHLWLTEDGPVTIVVEGDSVLVAESLDRATTDKLEQQVLPATTDK